MRAHLCIISEKEKMEGMFGSFFWNSALKDLSQFNEIIIRATVAQGKSFSVGIGRNEGTVYYGCTWNLIGKGDTTYAVDLLTPALWCGPAPAVCFDLQAQGIGIGNAWNADSSSIDILVESVKL